jgi:hypothetical protein
MHPQPFAVDHPDLGRLERTDVGEGLLGAWHRSLDVSEIGIDWRCTLVYLWDGSFHHQAYGYSEAPTLCIENTDDAQPSAHQISAWNAIRSNQSVIRDYTQAALAELIRDQAAWEKTMLRSAEGEERFARTISEYQLLSQEGVAKQAQLSVLSLLGEHRNGVGYAVLEFLWTWSEDHRAAILLHGSRMVSAYVEDGSGERELAIELDAADI